MDSYNWKAGNARKKCRRWLESAISIEKCAINKRKVNWCLCRRRRTPTGYQLYGKSFLSLIRIIRERKDIYWEFFKSKNMLLWSDRERKSMLFFCRSFSLLMTYHPHGAHSSNNTDKQWMRKKYTQREEEKGTMSLFHLIPNEIDWPDKRKHSRAWAPFLVRRTASSRRRSRVQSIAKWNLSTTKIEI